MHTFPDIVQTKHTIVQIYVSYTGNSDDDDGDPFYDLCYDVLDNCMDGLKQLMDMDENMFLSKLVSLSGPGQPEDLTVFHLEHTLLKLSATLTKGILYYLPVPVEDGNYIVR